MFPAMSANVSARGVLPFDNVVDINLSDFPSRRDNSEALTPLAFIICLIAKVVFITPIIHPPIT